MWSARCLPSGLGKIQQSHIYPPHSSVTAAQKPNASASGAKRQIAQWLLITSAASNTVLWKFEAAAGLDAFYLDNQDHLCPNVARKAICLTMHSLPHFAQLFPQFSRQCSLKRRATHLSPARIANVATNDCVLCLTLAQGATERKGSAAASPRDHILRG